jgi:hypothetical protein
VKSGRLIEFDVTREMREKAIRYEEWRGLGGLLYIGYGDDDDEYLFAAWMGDFGTGLAWLSRCGHSDGC